MTVRESGARTLVALKLADLGVPDDFEEDSAVDSGHMDEAEVVMVDMVTARERVDVFIDLGVKRTLSKAARAFS